MRLRHRRGQHERRHPEPMPEKYEELARYNAMAWKGFIFHPMYDERMRYLQAEFDLWKVTHHE